jgi:hypothetical protein
MTTPWERLIDESFKRRLLDSMPAEEYNNETTPMERRTLLTQFQQHQQHERILLDREQIQKVVAFAEAQMEGRTKNKRMSEASGQWAESILAAYSVKHEREQAVIHEKGSREEPPPYKWNIETADGKISSTPGAVAWLKKFLLTSHERYDVKIIAGENLPKVKGNRRSATGKADVAIGVADDIKYGDTFAFTRGSIELKTDQFSLKTGQNLLQLLSLSTASSFKKGVALLATDCGKSWEVFHFSDANTIQHRVYQYGGKGMGRFYSPYRFS